MKNNLFIPKKIKVGFQNRKDTYTGKLGYVIYQDEKDIWRKEKSWNQWRDQSIQEIEFDNKPVNGFVLNKGLQRVSYHWGSGRSVIRVYDSRDFEFEVSVDNLLGILTHSDVSKREIVEEMVFAWAGTELVLLPANSEAYQESIKFTNQQDKKLSTKDLKSGFLYRNKKSNTDYVYIGFYNWWAFDNTYCMSRKHLNKGKKHIFASKGYGGEWEYSTPGVSTLFEVDTTEPVENSAELISKFFETIHAHRVVSIRTERYDITLSSQNSGYRYHKILREVDGEPNTWYHANYADHYNKKIYFEWKLKITFSDSIEFDTVPFLEGKNQYHYYDRDRRSYFTEHIGGQESTYSYNLYLVLENGKEIKWKL